MSRSDDGQPSTKDGPLACLYDTGQGRELRASRSSLLVYQRDLGGSDKFARGDATTGPVAEFPLSSFSTPIPPPPPPPPSSLRIDLHKALPHPPSTPPARHGLKNEGGVEIFLSPRTSSTPTGEPLLCSLRTTNWLHRNPRLPSPQPTPTRPPALEKKTGVPSPSGSRSIPRSPFSLLPFLIRGKKLYYCVLLILKISPLPGPVGRCWADDPRSWAAFHARQLLWKGLDSGSLVGLLQAFGPLRRAPDQALPLSPLPTTNPLGTMRYSNLLAFVLLVGSTFVAASPVPVPGSEVARAVLALVDASLLPAKLESRATEAQKAAAADRKSVV